MGKLLENLKRYFEESPQDVLDRDWEELEHFNDIGPDAVEYMERVRACYGSVMLDCQANAPVVRYQQESFKTEYEYFLAA